LSSRRAHALLLSFAFAVLGAISPGRALATIHSPQPVGDLLISAAGATYPALPESDVRPATDAAWTAREQEDTAGFTEIAMAYDPNPVRQPGDSDEAADTAGVTVSETTSHVKIPEPATLVLFGTTLVGVAYATRKKPKR